MPLSRAEADVLVRLATRNAGVSARCEPADNDHWAVIVTDTQGEHRITSGADFNRWDHGSSDPQPTDVPAPGKRSRFRFLGWTVTAFFNLVVEVAAAFYPATAGRRRAERYHGNNASRDWAQRHTHRGKR